MPFIDTKNTTEGIRGLMQFRPETGRALEALAQSLLVEASPLTRFERELIATYVSSKNNCEFCTKSHNGIATALATQHEKLLLQQTLEDLEKAPLSAKIKSLVRLAGAVQKSGSPMTQELIQLARQAGASDVEIHDTVLIAAAFCLFNRYVDGLGAIKPNQPETYTQIGQMIADHGYIRPLQ